MNYLVKLICFSGIGINKSYSTPILFNGNLLLKEQIPEIPDSLKKREWIMFYKEKYVLNVLKGYPYTLTASSEYFPASLLMVKIHN